MEQMRANPKVREWWAMTDGMQVRMLSYKYLTSLFANEVVYRKARFLEPWAVLTVLGGGRSWMRYSIMNNNESQDDNERSRAMFKLFLEELV